MKLRLSVQSGSLSGQERELETGSLLLGRGPDCALVFNPTVDNMVSTRHAYIQQESDGFYVVDNNSTNGTFHNGQRVSRAKLNNGDYVELGVQGPRIVFTIAAPQPVVPPQPAYAAPTNPPLPPPFPMTNPAGGGFAPGRSSATAPPFPAPPSGIRHTITNLGMYNPDRVAPKASSGGKYVGIAIGIILSLILGVIVLGLVLLELSPIAAIIAAVVAFVPVTIYILPLLWLDRYDPEPPWALASAFLWGGLAAIVFSFIVNTALGLVASAVGGPAVGNVVGAVISAPIMEEASKGFGLLLILIFLRREFDDIVDGIVYGGVIALGFATVENVFYYGRALQGAGFGGLIVLFFIRGILSPFAHVTFTSMTGIGCGIARESYKPAVRFLMPLVGYIGAVTLHMIWNGMATFLGGGFFIGYLVFEVPFFLIFVGFMFYVARRENKILRESLAIEVARGLIPQEHLNIATSAFKRTGWVFGGKFSARRKYLRAISKLGMSYWHVQLAQAAQSQTRSLPQIPILQAEIMELQGQI
jgi:RsiW-degrading membrane proteinase PrsW (M82 family)